MNTKFIQYNFEEIQEEVEIIFAGLKRGSAYTHEEYYRSMQHLIHHVNIAWNARDAEPGETVDADLKRWSHFPTDIRLI